MCITFGEWVQLIYCAPTSDPILVGILLLDCKTNQLHVRCRPAWWAQFKQDEEDIEVVHAFVADLEQSDVRGDLWLDWIEQTASHTLRISERQPVEIESVVATLDRLYALSLNDSRSVRTNKSFGVWRTLFQPIDYFRQQASSLAAATLMLLIVGPNLSNNRDVDTPYFVPVAHQAQVMELPIVYPPRREILLPGGHVGGARFRRERKPQLPHHRNFQTPAVLVQPRLQHVTQVGPAPSLAVSIEPSTPIIVPGTLSSVAPPYHSKSSLAKLASAVLTPFRVLAGNNSQKPNHKGR